MIDDYVTVLLYKRTRIVPIQVLACELLPRDTTPISWRPSEIDVVVVVDVANEDWRPARQRIDRLHGADVVVRERSHAARLLRSHGARHVPRRRQRRPHPRDGVHRRVGAQLGSQTGLGDPRLRSARDAGRLHDGTLPPVLRWWRNNQPTGRWTSHNCSQPLKRFYTRRYTVKRAYKRVLE